MQLAEKSQIHKPMYINNYSWYEINVCIHLGTQHFYEINKILRSHSNSLDAQEES